MLSVLGTEVWMYGIELMAMRSRFWSQCRFIIITQLWWGVLRSREMLSMVLALAVVALVLLALERVEQPVEGVEEAV